MKSKLSSHISEIEAETEVINSQISKSKEERDSLERLRNELKNFSALTCYAHKNAALSREFHVSCYSPLCRERLSLLSTVRELCGEANESAISRKMQNIQYYIDRNQAKVTSLKAEVFKLKQEVSDISQKMTQNLTDPVSEVYKLSFKKNHPSTKLSETTKNHGIDADIFSLPPKGLRSLAQNGDLDLSAAPDVRMPGCFVQKNATSAPFWPYFCDRPTNKLSWRYKIRSALEQLDSGEMMRIEDGSDSIGHVCVLASTALCIKLLHACVRWDELRELKSLNLAQIPGVTFLSKG